MDGDVLFFFRDHMEALAIYQRLEEAVTALAPEVKIKVSKTQIAFSNRRGFAYASFLPVRKAKDRPPVFLTVTFGLGDRLLSPRIDGAVEPYPNRWTHHVMVGSPEEIDGELMGWIAKAAEFSAGKR